MDGKTLVEFALQAGRKRQRKQTGYVHHSYESCWAHEHDTIPLYENFCFALALFKSRLSENVLEGKALVGQLLHFQVEGNFPVYLHEYPVCKNPHLGGRIRVVLQAILQGFYLVLGGELKAALERGIAAIPELTLAGRKQRSPEEWAEGLVTGVVGVEQVLEVWHPQLHLYTGPGQAQEKGEPAVTLLDLYMGGVVGRFSKRAVEDHPVHLRAALLSPRLQQIPIETKDHYITQDGTVFWGDGDTLHSLAFYSKKGKGVLLSEGLIEVTLPESLPEEGEERVESAFYCNVHPDSVIYVNGKRATTFQLEDTVQIVSKGVRIELHFQITEGTGRFFGHIARGNRPGQRSTKGENQYAAYDTQVGIRTLERSPRCAIQITQSFKAE